MRSLLLLTGACALACAPAFGFYSPPNYDASVAAQFLSPQSETPNTLHVSLSGAVDNLSANGGALPITGTYADYTISDVAPSTDDQESNVLLHFTQTGILPWDLVQIVSFQWNDEAVYAPFYFEPGHEGVAFTGGFLDMVNPDGSARPYTGLYATAGGVTYGPTSGSVGSGGSIGLGNIGSSPFRYGVTDGDFSVAAEAQPVPEPATLGLTGAGLILAGVLARRRRRA